jgi:hypothetical protein
LKKHSGKNESVEPYFSKSDQTQFKSELLRRLYALDNELSSKTNEHFITLGKIVHCHLAVEKMILKYIKHNNPQIGAIEKYVKYLLPKARLATEIPNSMITPKIFQAIQELNTIRNDFGHKIDALEIHPEKMKTITEIVSSWNFEREFSAVEKIQVFVAESEMRNKILDELLGKYEKPK